MAAVEFAFMAGAMETSFKGGELVMRSFSDSPSVDRIVRCRGKLQYVQCEYGCSFISSFPKRVLLIVYMPLSRFSRRSTYQRRATHIQFIIKNASPLGLANRVEKSL